MKNIENHKQAAMHFEEAAKHHREAAKQYEAGENDKANFSILKALGHKVIASGYQKENLKDHASIK